MVKQTDLLFTAQSPGAMDLAQRVKDTIPELIGVSRSFLEAVGVIDAEKHSISEANAEKHFEAAHKFWKNEAFVNLYFKLSYEHPHLMDITEIFSKLTFYTLQETRFNLIRKDISLMNILNDPSLSVRMRGAISILIRYWCMEFMLEDYFFKDIGLYALGLDISLETAAVAKETLNSEGEEEMSVCLPEKRAAGPMTSARESKRSRPITMPCANEFSPIYQLLNVQSIQCLAQDLERNKQLIDLAEELLKTLVVAKKKKWGEKSSYLQHCKAMSELWRNKDFRVLMREHLLKDPHLLVMVKMFSDQFKREITMDRLQRICSPEVASDLRDGGFDMEKPVDMIRCALTIMMRFWACVGFTMRVRDKKGFRPYNGNGKPLVKYAADLKGEQIGKLLYYVVQTEDPDFVLTCWCEENQTRISQLLDKDGNNQEWREVITRRYSRNGDEIKSLLGKIDVDTRMKLVLKKDSSGFLCVSCTI